jgi:DNA invertase Pin-like site-specific DNA recombinase
MSPNIRIYCLPNVDPKGNERTLARCSPSRRASKYAGRVPNTVAHQSIVALRASGETVRRTADLTGCSPSQLKRIWAIHSAGSKDAS